MTLTWVSNMGQGANTRTIEIDSGPVAYTIRRSRRAKRIQMRFVPGQGFEVVLPARAPMREVEPFVRGAVDWMRRTLATMTEVGVAAALGNGSATPYLGERLRIQQTSGTRDTVQRVGDTLVVTLRHSGAISVNAAVEAWYRVEARRVLAQRAAAHAATLGVDIGRVTIKDTRSRWGSCSNKGNLNFSWRLLLAPYAVMDYVAAHEVAHLREPNHSPRFWALVESLCPDYRTHRAWLREHGRELTAWPNPP
jgi:predicted metal-dependent hydrolase